MLFGGINVGKVTSVRPSTSDPTKIEILLSVKQGTPMNQGSVAKLGMTSVMSEASLSITTGSNDAKRPPPGSSIPSQEVASLDEIAGKMATVADSANELIVQARGELVGISGDARNLLADLNAVTGPPTQRKVQTALDHVNTLLATEGPKIDRLADQLTALSQHADETVQNVNGTVSDVREPVRKDLVDLQDTLQQAKQLLGDMQVMVRANDYKIDDTVENLRVATDNLDQLTDSLKQRPWSLIRVKQPKERAVHNNSEMYMKKKLTAISVVLTAVIFLAGCGGAVKYPHYYTLHVPPPPDPPARDDVHESLAVREFRSPTYLHQGAIVYKTSPEQIGFYNYHRWAVDPREVVTNAVTDRLRASGNFTQVKLYDGRSDVDCILIGRIEKLEEVDYDGGVKVEVAISAQMTSLATGTALWTNTVDEVGTVDQRNVPAIVSEMNRTMGRAIEKLLTPPLDRQQLASEPRSNNSKQ